MSTFLDYLIFVLAVYRDIEKLKFEESIVTIGSFDGVHCGHNVLLRRVVDLAKQHSGRSVVVTFWPHPRHVLDKKGDAPLLLNTLDEKIALLEQTGVDDIVVFPFDGALSQMSASDFVSDVIIGKLNARYLVAGKDHHFGKGRSGNVYHLPEFIVHSDLQIDIVDLKMFDQKISSSAIRKALLEGDLQLANDMLGYEYIISGKVISGNHLGHTIGFPTANIDVPDYKLLPKEGVYRVKVCISGVCPGAYTYIGMAYIGKRPVLKEQDATLHVEVNIFDFDQQIYGQEVTLALTHRIRNDINFENIQQLAGQLEQDKQNILKILS